MKLKITCLGKEPVVTVEIEDDPETCAEFLVAFEKLRQSEPEPEQKPEQSKVAVTARRSGDDSPRTYGGKPNRRHMVLSAMQKLLTEGNETPVLDDIRSCYSSLFPQEPVKHLGQVVRDLSNKTHLVERLEYGKFRLRSSEELDK